MPQEVEYIRKERSTLFRANQALTDPSEIKEKVRYLQVTAFLPCAGAQLAGAWSAHRWEAALTDGPSLCVHQLEEGENRLQIGLHYGIAYPRLHHAKVPPTPTTKITHTFHIL